MRLTFDTAMQSLVDTAQATSHLATANRLGDLAALIGPELSWVERTLSQAIRTEEEPAARAAAHLVERGGKRIRPTAVLLAAACFGAVPAAAKELAVVVELVHTATLLHDDVVDDGTERRGASTPRLIWGNALSVLAGDALLVQALERTQIHAPALLTELLETLRRLVSGEIVQLRGRRELDLSQPTYEGILSDKTASLFRFATSAGAALGGADERQRGILAQFGERLGMAFQFVDDVLDYTSQNTGKTLHADLLEGKVTLPLVLAARSDSEVVAWVQRVRDGEQELVERLRDRVVASGACELVRQRAWEHTSEAAKLLDAVAESPARALLKGIARELVQRTQ
jgi:octaprenyl-diphosphate synthase